MNIVESYKKENKIDERYETNNEYENRIRYELVESKLILEKKLKKDVKFLCWPVGAATKKALEIARDAGYISATASKYMKDEERIRLINMYGENASIMTRIGATQYWNGIAGWGSKTKYKNGFLLGLSLYSYQEKKVSTFLNKFIFLLTNFNSKNINKIIHSFKGII